MALDYGNCLVNYYILSNSYNFSLVFLLFDILLMLRRQIVQIRQIVQDKADKLSVQKLV